MIVVGNSLNDYTTSESSQKFQTIHDATSLVQPGFYLAKVDLKSTYKSIRISEMSQQFTGLNLHLIMKLFICMTKNCLSGLDWHLVYVALFDPSSQT